MYYQLARKNLAAAPQRTFMTVASIALAIAAITVLTGLSGGVKGAVLGSRQNVTPFTEFVVQPAADRSVITIFGGSKNAIPLERLEQIQKFPGVQSAWPFMPFEQLSSLQVTILGQNFQTDAMIFGVPYEVIEDTGIDRATWENPASPYPTVISKKVLDLYNFTIAPTNNLPNFTGNQLQGQQLAVLPGTSTFFPRFGSSITNFHGVIKGLSDKTELVGITLPLPIVRDLNRQANPEYTERYTKLLVRTNSVEEAERAKEAIIKMGLSIARPQQEVEAVENSLQVISISMGAISLLILIIAGLAIAGTFFSIVRERQSEIGLMRTLGATHADIQKLFLAEASLVGLIGGVLGIIIGLLAGGALNQFLLKSLPPLVFAPKALVVFHPGMLLFTLLFAVLFSILFAFIPSSKASQTSPLSMLNK